MLRRTVFATLTSLAIATASFAANADILFANLGNVAPPATIGGLQMTPFDQTPQAAIPDFTSVSAIPGAPGGANLGIAPVSAKYTRGTTWNGSPWAGGYNGALYFNSGLTRTLTLPTNTRAFYFYVESNYYGSTFSYTVTTDSGATSEPVSVAGGGGGHGFAFYSTAGENIASVTVTGVGLNNGGFTVGQFGINGEFTTCASEGYKGAQLTWCQNICENGLTGQVLDTWIHRWIKRYRDLPYCAVEQPEEPPQEA